MLTPEDKATIEDFVAMIKKSEMATPEGRRRARNRRRRYENQVLKEAEQIRAQRAKRKAAVKASRGA